ncbi:MAG: DUF4040 domain-containing protein [Candidatus Aenigmarchaeota archaeon]|nr:DUF4040 domain-containing protein [Candidatus Aenigmarchaeota archaeon]
MIDAVHWMLSAGIIAAAVMALKGRDLLASVIYLSAMSLMLSLEFYLLQAPDVAIAEAAVGTGLSTAIYIAAIKKTERMEHEGT